MDTLFFWISKLFWVSIAPGNLLVWLAVLVWFLYWRGFRKPANRLLTGLVCALLLIAWLPVGEWLLHPLERRFELPAVTDVEPQGILLLGGSFSLSLSESHGRPELLESADRVLAFLQLAGRFPESRLVFTGGSGSLTNQGFKESDVVLQLVREIGFDTTRLAIEDDSRNTWENARNSQSLVLPAPDQEWLLITSAFHMPRAVGAFCRLGWKVRAYPVDYRTPATGLLYYNLDFASHLTVLNVAVREWIGLIVYRLGGKTKRLVPGPDDTCAP